MAKRQKTDSTTETAALANVERSKPAKHVLTRHLCGHVGRENDAPKAKAKAWIRVAELRGALVEDDSKKCVDCK